MPRSSVALYCGVVLLGEQQELLGVDGVLGEREHHVAVGAPLLRAGNVQLVHPTVDRVQLVLELLDAVGAPLLQADDVQHLAGADPGRGTAQ